MPSAGLAAEAPALEAQLQPTNAHMRQMEQRRRPAAACVKRSCPNTALNPAHSRDRRALIPLQPSPFLLMRMG
eukprot:364922-Chlamydomonas_euryale.AAC.5